MTTVPEIAPWCSKFQRVWFVEETLSKKWGEKGKYVYLRPAFKADSKFCRLNPTAVNPNSVVQVSIDWLMSDFCLGLVEDAHLALAQLGRTALSNL